MHLKLGSIVGGRGEDRAGKVTTHTSLSAPAIMIGTFPRNGIVFKGSDLEDKMIVVEECQTSRQCSSSKLQLPKPKEVDIGYYEENAVYIWLAPRWISS